MKKFILLIAILYISDQASAQKRRRSSSETTTAWKVSNDVFTSGDTLIFTFTNTNYPKFYCYKGSEFYTLYKIINRKEILVEDTTFRGQVKPEAFLQGDKLIVKKLITQPGSYVIQYPLYYDTDRPAGQKRRLDMKQYFDVDKKP